MTPELPLIEPDWPAPPGVRACCSTRRGGVSEGPYRGLNLSFRCGDDPQRVAANRSRLRAALGLAREPAWLRQVHGAQVVRAPFDGEAEADAAWTLEPGLACAVMAADCLPVLFCDRDATVVAAAHAGWRGMVAGVLERTVAALPVSPPQLLAWLGPAIGPAAFEVGAEVRDAFLQQDARAKDCFVPGRRAGKFHADLYALARQRLESAGVTAVSGGTYCTWSDPDRFYSYRRDGSTGRQAALIWLQA